AARRGERHAEAAGVQVLGKPGPRLGAVSDIAAVPAFAHEAATGAGGGAVRVAEPLRDARQVIRRVAENRVELRPPVVLGKPLDAHVQDGGVSHALLSVNMVLRLVLALTGCYATARSGAAAASGNTVAQSVNG